MIIDVHVLSSLFKNNKALFFNGSFPSSLRTSAEKKKEEKESVDVMCVCVCALTLTRSCCGLNPLLLWPSPLSLIAMAAKAAVGVSVVAIARHYRRQKHRRRYRTPTWPMSAAAF